MKERRNEHNEDVGKLAQELYAYILSVSNNLICNDNDKGIYKKFKAP